MFVCGSGCLRVLRRSEGHGRAERGRLSRWVIVRSSIVRPRLACAYTYGAGRTAWTWTWTITHGTGAGASDREEGIPAESPRRGVITDAR